MNSIQFKVFFLVLFSAIFFQSCSEDEELNLDSSDPSLTAVETLRGNNGGPGGNGGGPGGGPGGGSGNQNNQVDRIENDVVKEWTDLILEIDRYATGMRPTASARSFAYIYLAAYETAVNGMDQFKSNDHRLDGLEIDKTLLPSEIDWELALNSSFAQSVNHFIYNIPISSIEKIGELQEELASEYSSDLTDAVAAQSIAWGTYIADQVIAYSQTDEAGEAQLLEPQPTSYVPPTGDGYWTFSAEPERALFPYWGTARTFVISPEETTTVPPIAYSETEGSDYFDQMMECYTANNEAREEDGEELWIAEFWSDDVENTTYGPPARQLSISNQLMDKFDLDLEEALVLYLKLGFSLNDAAVATWKYKYEYMVMRPNVYIHEFIDPDFQTNLFRLIPWPNPSFPGYPSGHSAFASAAAGVFIDQFGNNTRFTDRSHENRTEFRGAPREFSNLREMAAENAFSRIPLGVHMRMDCTEGLRLGYEISDAINDLKLKDRDRSLANGN